MARYVLAFLDAKTQNKRVRTLVGSFFLIMAVLAASLSVLAVFAVSGVGRANESDSAPVVLELFTSQGCSSCPPADELLTELAQRENNVIALAFHITYWDRLGWKDPFGKEWATQRQHSYRKWAHRRSVFTPQLVVDGKESVVGSRKRQVRSAVYRNSRSEKFRPRLGLDGDFLVIGLPRAPSAKHSAVLVFGYLDPQSTKIPRGENRGRLLENTRIAASRDYVSNWSGQEAELRSALVDSGNIAGYVVLVQDRRTGHILGANEIRLPSRAAVNG